MIHVGYTGTRHGMSPAQLDHVIRLVTGLYKLDELTAHHGDCVGGDNEFHDVMTRFARAIVIHAPVDRANRAYCDRDQPRGDNRHDTIVMPAKTHFARNRDIVIASSIMIAAPYEPIYQTRGGTWYTVDYARKMGKPLALVLRNQRVAYVEFSGAPWPVKESN